MWKTLFSALVFAFFASSSAFAGQASIKNCGHQDTTVTAFNDNDNSFLIGASSAHIRVGETKTLHCKTNFCRFSIHSTKIKPYKSRTYYIEWPPFGNPRLIDTCKMPEKLPGSGKVHVKNCTPKSVTVHAYNQYDDARLVSYSHATIPPNGLHTLTCGTRVCGLRVNGVDNKHMTFHGDAHVINNAIWSGGCPTPRSR